MGLADAFGYEEKANIKMSTLYAMMKEAAISELLQNAVKCDVPHRHIREMFTGKKEEPACADTDAEIEDSGEHDEQ